MNQSQLKPFSTKQRLKSFVYAFSGIWYFFRREHNAWIHAVAAIAVLIIALVMRLTAMEMIAILLSIAMVWIAEMFNTAIEKIMDHVSPAYHPDVKIIKDLAAAAVLVAACMAFLIGLTIFIPKFL